MTDELKAEIVDALTGGISNNPPDIKAMIGRLADDILAVVRLKNAETRVARIAEELVPAIEAVLAREADTTPRSVTEGPAPGFFEAAAAIPAEEPADVPELPKTTYTQVFGPKEGVTSPTVAAEEAEAIDTLIARHRGGGSYSILRNGVEVVEGLTKTDSVAFNMLSYAERQAYIAGLNKA